MTYFIDACKRHSASISQKQLYHYGKNFVQNWPHFGVYVMCSQATDGNFFSVTQIIKCVAESVIDK